MTHTPVLARRVLAYCADVSLLFAVLGPLSFAAAGALDVDAWTGPEVWLAAVLVFSIPTWTYFTVSDASRGGATLGKRLLAVRVAGDGGGRVPPSRALARTAVKLLPWEMVHLFGFLLSPVPGEMSPLQTAGLAAANLLALAYLAATIRTRGERAPHDRVARTHVERVPAPERAAAVA
ncbi:RDD family protein [Longimicrobium sp.]|uniref:RDD family protein n=1 Tax=Longimicrobium sp. TaxID=2029185 RepID=UPI002B5E180D|nr:RDD family protein [Longimicrobium sp.]HSU16349.1 RDD family protein [Longimicrobium sp.]